LVPLFQAWLHNGTGRSRYAAACVAAPDKVDGDSVLWPGCGSWGARGRVSLAREKDAIRAVGGTLWMYDWEASETSERLVLAPPVHL